MAKKKKWSKPTKIIVSVVVVLIAITIIGSAASGRFFIQCEKEVQVPYDAQETYTENEPYMSEECETVQVPYTDKICHNIQVPYSEEVCTQNYYSYAVENKGYHYWSITDTTCWVQADIVNHEDNGGSFIAYTHFELVGEDFVYNQTHWVYANSKKTVRATYDCAMGEDINLYHLTIKPPLKTDCETVTKYRSEQECNDVIKYRNELQCSDVTKYREVEKTRTVTKYKTETESSFSACFD
ncbi:MAG: hypothetical protein ABIE55_03640 [Candidatus Aenigmatarchaeota archaeon]